MSKRACIYMHECLYVLMCIHVYTHMCVRMCAHACMACAYMCICVFVLTGVAGTNGGGCQSTKANKSLIYHTPNMQIHNVY